MAGDFPGKYENLAAEASRLALFFQVRAATAPPPWYYHLMCGGDYIKDLREQHHNEHCAQRFRAFEQAFKACGKDADPAAGSDSTCLAAAKSFKLFLLSLI